MNFLHVIPQLEVLLHLRMKGLENLLDPLPLSTNETMRTRVVYRNRGDRKVSIGTEVEELHEKRCLGCV